MIFVQLRQYARNLPLTPLLQGAIILTLGFVLLNGRLGWDWVGQPFAGFLHRQQVVSANGLAYWSVWKSGLEPGDRLVAINDRPPAAGDLDGLRFESGQSIEYTLQKTDGRLLSITLPLRLFTHRDFIQLLLIPTFITLITLLSTVILLHLRPRQRATQLFALTALTATYSLNSQPDFVNGGWFYLNYVTFMAGTILMPPLQLHFLHHFLLSEKSKPLRDFWLPLNYMFVLPFLLCLPFLFESPAVRHSFEHLLDGYVALYLVAGFVILLRQRRQGDELAYKKSLVLLVGFALPLIFLAFWGATLLLPTVMFPLEPIHETIKRYLYWAVPLSGLLALLRYEIFGLRRSSYRQVFYVGVIGLIFAVSILLITISSSLQVGPNRLRFDDLWLIISTIILVTMGGTLFRQIWRWWTDRTLSRTMEDYGINLRILSSELLKITSRRDLEALVSWNIPTDFGLQSAELSATDVPRSPYALSLPLRVRKIPLGTLFLGPRIGGGEFSRREREIFAEVQNQIALATLTLELDKATQATEALTRLKSKFLANVTHELRTPLNGIINYIGFVLDEEERLEAEQISHLRQALAGGETLLDLINNILDMSKIEAGQMKLMKGKVDLAKVVAETTPLVTDSLNGKPVDLSINVAENLPAIQGDRLRLRQIMLNLLLNAAKFTDQGRIELNVYPKNGHVVIEVSDTGPGIDVAIAPVLFQGFISTKLTDAQQMKGPGLGLPIAKHLIELHNGRIDVSSQPGVGTTLTVNLPVR